MLKAEVFIGTFTAKRDKLHDHSFTLGERVGEALVGI